MVEEVNEVSRLLDRLDAEIRASINRLISHTAFVTWLRGESCASGDLIQLNNSFLFRDGVKTTKNTLYVFLPIGEAGGPMLEPQVGEGQSLNNDFRVAAARSNALPRTVPIKAALTKQLDALGCLVLILAGSVADDVVFTEPVRHRLLREIVLDPAAPERVSVDDGVVRVRDTDDPDTIWVAIQESLSIENEEEAESLKSSVGQALDKLDESSYARLLLPGDGRWGEDSVLAHVVSALKDQRAAYASALDRCHGDPSVDRQTFNEILRISYNFASDVIGLIRLIVSICDLKPIVLWGTIAEHHALSEAFRALPWVRSKTKASLKAYAQTIGEARNSAFHHLFPFRKSLNVELGNGLQDVALRLFSDHHRKGENDLYYRDKELVEVLTDFTRAGEKRVPPLFWRKNLDVIDSTIHLFEATDELLRLLAGVLDSAPEAQAV